MVTIHLIGPCATSGPYANSAEGTPGFGVPLRSLAHPPPVSARHAGGPFAKSVIRFHRVIRP
jgi:hypothetical protein